MTLRKIALLPAIILLLIQPSLTAAATTLEISGNGSQSTSKVETTSTQEIKVEQSNESKVENKVEVDANTGNNTASDNTSSEVNIDSGDIKVNQAVTNNLNQNSAVVDNCCQETGGTTVTVSGNGDNSRNTAQVTSDKSFTITQSNQANVDNRFITKANTGGNQANHNTAGQVTVSSGNIQTKTSVTNQANLAYAQISGNSHDGLVVTIKKNGSGSANEISVSVGGANQITMLNQADINNHLFSWLNTGKNTANGNTSGLVNISTGDIFSSLNITNLINQAKAVVDNCCQKDDDEEPPQPTPSPTPKPGNDDDDDKHGDDNDDNGDDDDNGNGSDDSGRGGPSDAGQVLGAMLPATGGNALGLLAANGALFLAGAYLKFRRLFFSDYLIKITILY